MNVIKSIGIVLVLCMGLAFGSEAQTVRFGIYIAPSLTAPIQGPNTFIVRDYVPRAGVDVCGLVDIEVREKWKFRTGLGITSLITTIASVETPVEGFSSPGVPY